MKKIFLLTALLLSGLTYSNLTHAQVKVNVDINIGSQPVWGPTGYDHVDYYYLPDVDAYYDVPNQQFVYQQNNQWIHGASLPGQYRNYDLYKGYKVVVNQKEPWRNDTRYKSRYARYKNWNGKQPVIRDSRDQKYYVIKDHPMHSQYKGHDAHDNRQAHKDDHRHR